MATSHGSGILNDLYTVRINTLDRPWAGLLTYSSTHTSVYKGKNYILTFYNLDGECRGRIKIKRTILRCIAHIVFYHKRCMVTECKRISENFRVFRGFRPIRESFLREYFGWGDKNCNAQVACMRVRCACPRTRARPT